MEQPRLKVEPNPEQKEKYFTQRCNELIEKALDNGKPWALFTPNFDPDYYSNSEYAYSDHGENHIHIAKVIKENKEFKMICELKRRDRDVTIRSCSLENDEITKKVAISLAQTFNVTLQLNTFDPKDITSGTLKCKYCGQFTHNAEKCDTCGGVPI